MLEIMLTRPQSLFDQLESVHRTLARSFGSEGGPAPFVLSPRDPSPR